MNPESEYNKNRQKIIRFLRINLLVPLPEFDDFDTYNKELLKRSS